MVTTETGDAADRPSRTVPANRHTRSFAAQARALTRFHGDMSGVSDIARSAAELQSWMSQITTWTAAPSFASALAAADWKQALVPWDRAFTDAVAASKLGIPDSNTWKWINADLDAWVGIERSLLSLTQQFADSWLTDAWLPDFLGWLNCLDLGDDFPPNWPALNFSQVRRLAYRDGLPVCWVPRARILEQLRDTSGAGRQRVLLSHRRAVIDDCALTLAQVDAPELAAYAEAATALLAAMRDGHDRPAQAYAMTIIDAVLRDTSTDPSQTSRNFYGPLIARVRATQNPTVAEYRGAVTLWPLVRLFEPYRPGPSGLIPAQPNRHATTHTVDPVQYTPANALVSAMIAISVLRETQHGLHTQSTTGELLTNRSTA